MLVANGYTRPFTAYTADEFETTQPPTTNRSSSAYIKWVQQSLNKIMGLNLAVDGISGSMTRSAIRSFQTRAGLLADGIVGSQTEAAIKAALSGTPATPTTPTTPSPSTTPYSIAMLRNNIVTAALVELGRWSFGTASEDDLAMRPILEDYWRTITGSVPTAPNWWADWAWSAVFISYVMKKAGAGSLFDYSSRHTDYVGVAKRNREAGNNNPFKAYRRTEMAPQPGDLVCYERESSGVTYDNVDKGSYASHCDIVTEVRPGKIVIVGGNVSNQTSGDRGVTARSRERTIDANGLVTDTSCYAIVHVA